MPKIQQITIWILWSILFSVFLYFFMINGLPVVQEHYGSIFAFLCLIVIASLFPIKFRHTNIVPLHGISLAVFLQFGVYVEVLIIQLALFTSLLTLRLPRKEFYRYGLNSLIFLIVSIAAASVFYFAGGTTGNLANLQLGNMLIPIALYAFAYFLLNNWLIYLVRKYLVKLENTKFFDEPLAWEALASVLIVPVGIALVMFYSEVGYLAVILIGVPLVSVSLILKLYNESEKTGRLLKKVSAFGFQVNEGLSVKNNMDLFFDTVTSVFSVDQTYLYEKIDGELKITHTSPYLTPSSICVDGVSDTVYRNKGSLLFTQAKQWRAYEQDSRFAGAQSIMSVPRIHNNEVVGVITLVSNRKGAFEKSHLKVLEIMANFLSVAVQNSRIYEQKQMESEQCALTGLYNYRYFENIIIQKYDNPGEEDNFAIILLDLDHFKRINDTYGHNSGNEVLCQVANVLEDSVNDRGIVARYGGEEFVILLEGEKTALAEQLAEALRKDIESHLFSVADDLKGRERRSIRLTASIGVAFKSEPNESGMSVLRNADRAMYTGAKQKGRNKVSRFSSKVVERV